jgi:hypothetical protein
VKQVDVVTLARDEDLDLVIVAADRVGGGSLDVDEGDDAIQRDLDELINTPMFNRLWAPFYGHDFDRHAGTPGADVNPAAVINRMTLTWKRMVESDARVKPSTAKVKYDPAGEIIFEVESALTGELVRVVQR